MNEDTGGRVFATPFRSKRWFICECGKVFSCNRDFLSHGYYDYIDEGYYGVRRRVGHIISYMLHDVEYDMKLDRYRCMECGKIISVKREHIC